RQAGDAEFEANNARVVGDPQLLDGVQVEGRHRGRQVELAQAKVGAAEVNPAIVVVAIEGHLPAQAADGVAVGGGDAPGGALFGGERAPTSGDAGELDAHLL